MVPEDGALAQPCKEQDTSGDIDELRNVKEGVVVANDPPLEISCAFIQVTHIWNIELSCVPLDGEEYRIWDLSADYNDKKHHLPSEKCLFYLLV